MALGDTLKNYVIGVGVKDNNFTAGLKNMGGQLKGFVSQMGIMLGAGSLGLAFKKFIDTGTDISNFSSLTGIAEQDITALGGVLEQFGGNVDSAKSSLQALQQGLSQAEWGQGQLLETAALYGVELYNQDGSLKNAQQLLTGLASDFEHLTKAQQFTLGSQLGLDESTILLLQQGKANIKALLAEQQKMGAMNSRQALEAKKFSIEWTKLKQSLGSLGRSIAVDIMPPVIDFVKQLGKAVDWVRNLDTYTIMLAASFGVVGYALKNFTQIATFFSKSFWKANLPLVAITTALTLLFLIVEDIYSWSQGKKSIFGEILENDRIKKVISDIQNAFAWVKDLVSGFSFDNLLEKISNIGNIIKNIFTETFDYIKDMIATIGTNIGAFIVNPLIDVLNKLPFFNLKLKKLETKEMPEFKNYINHNMPVTNNNQNTQNTGVNNNTQNNNTNIFKEYNTFQNIKNMQNLPVVPNQTSNSNNTNNNTLNNNITVNMQPSGDSLQDITKAVEKGFNSNYISPALLLNGAK